MIDIIRQFDGGGGVHLPGALHVDLLPLQEVVNLAVFFFLDT